MKDRLKAFLPFKRNGGSSVVVERNQSQHDLQMAAAAMEASENISAGTKLKWTLAVKEELISFLNETDEWLRQLHEISKLCARERALGNQITNPFDVALRVRKAAKDLFTAIQKPHHPHSPRVSTSSLNANVPILSILTQTQMPYHFFRGEEFAYISTFHS